MLAHFGRGCEGKDELGAGLGEGFGARGGGGRGGGGGVCSWLLVVVLLLLLLLLMLLGLSSLCLLLS